LGPTNAATLKLYYHERPPYAVTQPDGSVAGLTATPAAQALQAAAIPFIWVLLPSNRQIAVVQENHVPGCALGWFRNPEREAFARYTRALYQDHSPVAVASVDFTPRGPTLGEVLSQPDVDVLVKDRFSYGPYIDQLLARIRPTTTVTTVDSGQMLNMIERHRVDFMFAGEEEARAMLAQAGALARTLKIVHFRDAPAGEKRYLMCSRLVPPEWIERIDAVLPPLPLSGSAGAQP
jgi:hypothetical protein